MSKTSSVVILAAVLLAALAVSATGQAPGPGFNQPVPHSSSVDPIAQLSARIEALQAQVTQQQAQIRMLESHGHRYTYGVAPVNYWMSIGQLRAAMEPHSNTDINVNWIPVQVARGTPVMGRQVVSQTEPPARN